MSALTQALPLLSIVAGGVVALATFARDPKADEHDLSDYHDPAEQERALEEEFAAWAELDRKADYTWGRTDLPRPTARDREVAEPNHWRTATGACWSDCPACAYLPPAPEGMNAGSPLYAGMLFDTWFPETAEDTAARFLREIRDEALAGAR